MENGINNDELMDFDLSTQDISEFDPLIYKLTPEIAALLEKRSKIETSRAIKDDVISKLVVDVNGIPFAADDISQNRLSATGTIANWLFNKALGETFVQLSQNPDLDDNTKAMFGGLGQVISQIYDQVYAQTEIGWKGADNQIHMVHGQDVLNALYKSMQAVGNVIHKAATGELADEYDDDSE